MKLGIDKFVFKLIFTILLFNINTSISEAQTISSISKSICDSINKIEYSDEDEMAALQLGIYHKELVKYPTLIVDITNLNKPRQFNEYNYRINRELLQTCPNFIDQFSLLPLSKILDLEGLLNDKEYDSLERAIVQFIFFNKMDMIVATVDDYYPYKDLGEFAKNQLANWKVGARYERGGMIIAVSNEEKKIEIMLSKMNNGLISQEQLTNTIAIVNPTFENDNYFIGIMECIADLSE